MKMDRRTVMIAVIVVLLVAVAVLSIAASYFFSVAVSRKTVIIWEDDSSVTEKEPEEEADLDGEDWIKQQGYETWTIQSKDGLFLKGYYIKAEKETDKTVILIHGYGSRGMDMGSYARYYHEVLGYNVLMPDNRAHGQSEGEFIGFGWLDRLDYLQWIDRVIEQTGEDSKLLLHGVSMGGATVMMVSGEALPSQVKVLIEDCGYTSVRDQLTYQLKQMYDLPGFPIINATSLMSRIRAGYFFGEASALTQVKKNKLPMLFIHGEKDDYVPTKMVYELYDACTAPKELYIAKDAVHADSYQRDRKTYQEKVGEFLQNYMK